VAVSISNDPVKFKGECVIVIITVSFIAFPETLAKDEDKEAIEYDELVEVEEVP
jgi:hypothetical protein